VIGGLAIIIGAVVAGLFGLLGRSAGNSISGSASPVAPQVCEAGLPITVIGPKPATVGQTASFTIEVSCPVSNSLIYVLFLRRETPGPNGRYDYYPRAPLQVLKVGYAYSHTEDLHNDAIGSVACLLVYGLKPADYQALLANINSQNQTGLPSDVQASKLSCVRREY
jgi:hypothetical protein